MDEERIRKLENPVRVSELDPKNTLRKAGFLNNASLCDIGAGTGIFTFAAAALSQGDIYSLEISDIMIEFLNKRLTDQNTSNVKVLKVTSDYLPLPDSICDMAVMSTVLHEIENKDLMLREVKRILKNSGRLLIVDWHKRKTPIGPPVEHRLSERDAEEICVGNGFSIINRFLLTGNFYALVFEKQP